MVFLGGISFWSGYALTIILYCYRKDYRYCNADDTEFAFGILPFLAGVIYSSVFLLLFRIIFHMLVRIKNNRN